MSRKTYTYEDEVKARKITFILGVLYCIGAIIWLVLDGVNYDVKSALNILGNVFGPILAFLIFIGIATIIYVIIDSIRNLVIRKFFRKK